MRMRMIRDSILLIIALIIYSAFQLPADEYMLYEVQGSIEQPIDEEGFNPRSVYYNGAAYRFTAFQEGDWFKIRARKLVYNTEPGSEAFGKFTNHYDCKKLFADCNDYKGYNVAPVEYDGKLFVFYCIEGYGKNHIYYKTSLDPMQGFKPEKGFGNEAVGQRKTPSMPFTAFVYENKLHLAYMDSCRDANGVNGMAIRIRICNPNGAWADSAIGTTIWSRGYLNPNWMDSKVVQDIDGKSVPVLGIHFYDSSSKDDMFWLFKIDEGQISEIESRYLKGTSSGGFHILESGTSGMPAGNSLSVFVPWEKEAYATGMKRYQYKIGKSTEKIEFQSEEIMTFNNDTYYRSASPVLYYAGYPGANQNDPKNLQQFFSITITHKALLTINNDLRGVTFKNETFRYNGNTAILDSASHKDGKLLWTLVGVVEGVPPFVDAEGWTSTLQYGQSEEKSVSTTQSFSGSWYIGTTGGKKNVINAGLTYTQGWKEVQNYSKSMEAKVNISFTNKNENDLGEYGYLIYSQPTFRWDSYDRYAPDESLIMKNIVFGYVSGLSLKSVQYELANPPKGMAPMPKSSDPSKWIRTINYFPDSNIGEINVLTCSSYGASSSVSFSKTEVNTAEKSNSHSLKLDIKLGDKNTFMISTGGSCNWEYSSKTSTKVSSNINASLAYAGKGKGRMIEIRPYWLAYPTHGVPSWCPEKNVGDSPWCITWQVLSFEPQGASQENSPNSMGKNGSPAIVAAGNKIKDMKKRGIYSNFAVIYGIDKKGKCQSPIYFQHPDGNYLFLDTFSMDTEPDSALLWLNLDDRTLLIDQIADGEITESKTVGGILLDEEHEYLASDLFVWKDGSFRDAIALCETTTGNITVHSIDSDCNLIGSFEVLKGKGPQWSYLGNGDFNGDGIADILIQDFETGEMNAIILKAPDENSSIVEGVYNVLDTVIIGASTYTPADFAFIGIGDFNCDFMDDILIELPGNKLAPILMDGTTQLKAGLLGKMPKSLGSAKVADISDYNADGYADIVFSQPQTLKDGSSIIILKLACITSKGTEQKTGFTAKIKKLVKLGINIGDNTIIDSD